VRVGLLIKGEGCSRAGQIQNAKAASLRVTIARVSRNPRCSRDTGDIVCAVPECQIKGCSEIWVSVGDGLLVVSQVVHPNLDHGGLCMMDAFLEPNPGSESDVTPLVARGSCLLRVSN
jgi:hypothetical protein